MTSIRNRKDAVPCGGFGILALATIGCMQQPRIVAIDEATSIAPITEVVVSSPICEARLRRPRSCDVTRRGYCLNVYFNAESATILPSALPNLVSAAQNETLRSASSIVIIGLAEQSREGSRAAQIALERAQSAARVLREQGLNGVRMEMQSNVIDCSGSSSDVQDYRVEIFPGAIPIQ